MLVAENEPQDARLLRPVADGGYGLDAVWNDDYHHAAMVAISGRSEAYYNDTYGEPQEFVSAAKYGYLYQGQHYAWQRQPRGTPALDVAPAQFVAYLQNHDQVANSARGLRAHQTTSPARWRAITALTLLMPSTPMLFQGQEFSSSAPFLLLRRFRRRAVGGHSKRTRRVLEAVSECRRLRSARDARRSGKPKHFRALQARFRRAGATRGRVSASPGSAAVETGTNGISQNSRTHRRRRGPLPALVHAAAVCGRPFRRPGADCESRGDLSRPSFAEPLLAPPSERDWVVVWSSEDPRYGGGASQISGRMDAGAFRGNQQCCWGRVRRASR